MDWRSTRARVPRTGVRFAGCALLLAVLLAFACERAGCPEGLVERGGACVAPDAGRNDGGGEVDGGTPLSCMRSDECPAPTECFRDVSAACGGLGTCREIPSRCDDVDAPVCGCDGRTYPSECAAHRAGVSAARLGTCGNCDARRIRCRDVPPACAAGEAAEVGLDCWSGACVPLHQCSCEFAAECPGGLCCEGACADRERDPRHCGGCGRVCAPGQACDAAVCAPWERSLRGCDIRAIALDADGNVYACGELFATLDIGTGPLTPTGTSDVCVVSFTAHGDLRWARRFGGSDRANDRAGCFGLAVSPSGEALHLSGAFRGTIDFGGGPHTVSGEADAFVASLTTREGAHRWSRRLGGTGVDGAAGLAVDAAGAIYVTGWFSRTANFGGEPLATTADSAAFVASFDEDGEHRWSRGYGNGPAENWAYGGRIALDPEGRLYVVGNFYGTMVAFGGSWLSSAGMGDVFLLSLTSAGEHRWLRAYGGTGEDVPAGLAVGAGRVVIAGGFNVDASYGGPRLMAWGPSDVFVAAYGLDGAHLWSARYGGPDEDRGHVVGVSADGSVVVGGSFRGTADFGGGPLVAEGAADGFLLALDPSGRYAWALHLRAPDDVYPQALALLRTGERSGLIAFFRGTDTILRGFVDGGI